ncbi:MAG: hypothetical protein A07HB70_00377 [uncultured archaeon A07HB70]|nr:MAG: hypothetical protein A07HB70_00377 [uncultured archaeon A07HB70]
MWARLTDEGERDDLSLAPALGGAGLAAMVLAHLVWDPALTLLGVAAFGVGEEDAAFVRALLAVHPALWLGAKVLYVGGGAAVLYRTGAYRTPMAAVLLWAVAVYGVVAPLGWLELLLGVR